MTPEEWRRWEAYRDAWEATVHAMTNPLPPLDDLDEGLMCCGKKHPTFAKYMAHCRRHGQE
jgi:hypothetical protein